MTRIDADWLTSAPSQAVCRAMENAGHRVLFVGGCVRNALLDIAASDVDLATSAHPEETLSALTAAGLKAIPTGIEHGTVTAVSGEQPFEITTFRQDVETDGRHAVVRFSDRVEHDAARRDFTMNALYANASGEVIDPIGGLPDLQARRLRFIGDPVDRIAEDYLRILRFFRFQAWYADPAGGVDSEGLAACAAAADGLSQVSAERIWSELHKLLAAPDPAPSLAAMNASGVLSLVLPGAEPKPIAPLVHLETAADVAPSPLRRLAAMGGPDMVADLRLSRAEARELGLLRDALNAGEPAAICAWRHGAEAARDVALIAAASTGTAPPDTLERDIDRGAAATFPVSAADLMPTYKGPVLGERLRELQEAWLAAGMTLSKEELLSR